MKSKIDFVWFGITGRYGIWKDGLWAAMQILEKMYDVEYKEPTDEIRPEAVVLFWEAPCTTNHPENGIWYNRIMDLPNKKILLFAGGPLNQFDVRGFDHICVESQINADECEVQGIPYSVAFGVNTDIWQARAVVYKQYDGIHHGTCASWKRQWLVGEAVGNKGILIGRGQESDPYPFDRCRELGVTVLDEMNPEQLVSYMNNSHTCLQTSDYWGGGQRCTLEAMAAGVPVVCMTDSPKNREYVEESGFGMVVDPEFNQIRNAVAYIKDHPTEFKPRIGIDYVTSKWSHHHYADNLIKAIKIVCPEHQ